MRFGARSKFQQIQAQLREISLFPPPGRRKPLSAFSPATAKGLSTTANRPPPRCSGNPDAPRCMARPVAEMFLLPKTWIESINTPQPNHEFAAGGTVEITQPAPRRNQQMFATSRFFPIPCAGWRVYELWRGGFRTPRNATGCLTQSSKANARFEAVLNATDDGVIVLG